MTILDVIVIGLATWRISSLLVHERGPYNVFVHLRNAVGVEHDVDLVPERANNVVAEIFSCVWCMSIWVGLALWGVWEIEPKVVYVIAILAIAPIVETWHGTRSNSH